MCTLFIYTVTKCILPYLVQQYCSKLLIIQEPTGHTGLSLHNDPIEEDLTIQEFPCLQEDDDLVGTSSSFTYCGGAFQILDCSFVSYLQQHRSGVQEEVDTGTTPKVGLQFEYLCV